MAAKPDETIEEDATELRFGKDFDNADALLVSEVKMLLEHRKAQHESQDDDQDLSEVFSKTLEYCQTFSKYNSRETISSVRGKLQKHKLHKFEIACLANVVPADADEAKSLLPSSLFDLCYRLPVGLTPSSKKEGSGNAINVGTGNIDQLTSTSVTNILLHSWKDEFKFMLQTSGYSKYQHWLLSFRSLQGRFDDLELNELLDDIRTQMSFQY